LNHLSDNKLRDFVNRKVIQRIDQKILIYLIFVGISTIFWFLNKIGNDFTITVNYPVRYTNVPKSKVIVNEVPDRLQLTINGYGYTLLKYKLSPAPYPVIINLGDYGNQLNRPGARRFVLLTRNEREKISKQMPNDVEVIDVLPDTILFQFGNLIEKRIAIAPDLTLKFDQQCMLDGKINFIPDSVTVKGPNTVLDTLKAIYTKQQRFQGLNKNLQRNIALIEPDGLSIAKKKVVMNIPVSKFTEATIEVPIIPIHVPDSLELKTFPRTVNLSYMVSLNNYEKVVPGDFRLEVDYQSISNLLGQRLQVKLRSIPPEAHSVKFSPGNIEFILEKKK